ncbi:MAG: RpiB/LacA/LacB family sugar-phosphate isomerase [Bacilli bacterium]|nr:RpiB/LacA/LacB family sugar-phosphate isomerase [Bacilli bacterium]
MVFIKVFFGADHKGVKFKVAIIKHLLNNGIEVIDTGIVNNPDDDHPDFAIAVCHNVLANPESIGILVCSTGIGMSIDANKIKGIYCAKVDDKDDAFYAKAHNGANVLALGIKHDIEEVKEMIDTFLMTEGPSEERYLRRIEQVKNIEKEA